MKFLVGAVFVLLLTQTKCKSSSSQCKQHWFKQNIDHFGWGKLPDDKSNFEQRYFICYPQGKNSYARNSTIFFYFGNEDNVELYVNHTGLMWENAEEFGAVLVFAEHRYYGRSNPFPPGTPRCLNWLSTEQALADYASIITYLKAELSDGPIIGFGGSYGGMLAAWFRMKYPHLVNGVIAASAPIWAFLGLNPPYNDTAFNAIVTNDASSRGRVSNPLPLPDRIPFNALHTPPADHPNPAFPTQFPPAWHSLARRSHTVDA
jgi:lysosomal Pro-X carboxypeptidase